MPRPRSSEQFDSLVSTHGDKPHDTEDEGWEMESVGRHLQGVEGPHDLGR